MSSNYLFWLFIFSLIVQSSLAIVFFLSCKVKAHSIVIQTFSKSALFLIRGRIEVAGVSTPRLLSKLLVNSKIQRWSANFGRLLCCDLLCCKRSQCISYRESSSFVVFISELWKAACLCDILELLIKVLVMGVWHLDTVDLWLFASRASARTSAPNSLGTMQVPGPGVSAAKMTVNGFTYTAF